MKGYKSKFNQCDCDNLKERFRFPLKQRNSSFELFVFSLREIRVNFVAISPLSFFYWQRFILCECCIIVSK